MAVYNSNLRGTRTVGMIVTWITVWDDMKKSTRYDIAAALFGLCCASFGTHMFLFFDYFSSHPTIPNNALGLIYALNNHGSYVYLSETEWAGLSLLRTMSFVGFFSVFAILPKNPALAPPDTARWLANLYIVKLDSVSASPRLKTIFWSSIAFSLGVMYFAGTLTIHFLVAHGIIVQM